MRATAWAYILTNHPRHTTLYTGSSTDPLTRLWEHRTKRKPTSFTARYNVAKLVYYEGFASPAQAVKREKFIKGKTRKWKEELINKTNPEWRDLTEELAKKHAR